VTAEDLRPLMLSIAYRMVGSFSEAEDIVQEAFLRLHEAGDVESPKAWLSTVVCLSTTELSLRLDCVLAWVVVCTLTAGVRKVLDPDPAIGFISHALKFREAIAANEVLAPARTIAEMQRIVFNDYLDATLAGIAVTIVSIVVVYALFNIRKALSIPDRTAIEATHG